MAQIFWPFNPSTINYGFGYPPGYGGFHNGIDFGVGQGTELRATVSGVVRNNDAGQQDGAGVDITTPDGWLVRAWHVSKFLAPNGSQVNAGDVIALSGGARGTWGAGNSTGPHLHWGIKISNQWVDPASLNPQSFNQPQPTPVPPKRKNKNKMLMCHVPNGASDGKSPKFAIFAPGFFFEFEGQSAANAWIAQIGAGESAAVNRQTMDDIKKESLAGRK